jgi:serine phosphatase RsbU (regulator of sigma subunit)
MRRQRADAVHNADRILRAAIDLLRAQPDAAADDIAAAAGVSRATLYRHFGSRGRLVAAARERAAARSDDNDEDALRPPGQLTAGPSPLGVAEVLNTIPPHLLGDQIVSEARRLAGVTSVALYLIDLEGTHLRRLAGSEEFPETLAAPLAVGPELPREGLAPLALRGRALGVLLAVDAPADALTELARQAAASLALAARYTDVLDVAQRRRQTSPAAEIQQNLLPPRIARITGARLAGTVLPGYEIGGDWFDYVENRDGGWLGVADSMGSGTTAAAIGAVALGAFRAKRKFTGDLHAATLATHRAVRELPIAGVFVNAIIARWHGPSSTFAWIACGGRPPLRIDAGGDIAELPGVLHDALGRGAADRRFTIQRHRLAPGERLLLLSDGVLDRHTDGGERFGLPGVTAALRGWPGASPAETVRALQEAILDRSPDPLEDDATIVVLAPNGRDPV